MKSLKSMSLREMTKDAKNLPQVLRILKKFPYVDTDMEFWKDILKKYIWNHWVEELSVLRGDLLSGSDWHILCQDMVRGNAYIYTWYTNGTGKHLIEPMFARGFNEPYEPQEFIIRGTLPRPGTYSVCGMLWRRHNNPEMSFCAFGTSERDALERAIRWTLTLLLNTYIDGDYFFEFLDRYLSIKDETIDEHVPLLADILENPKQLRNPWLEFSYSYKLNWNEGPRSQNCGMTFSNAIPFPKYDTEDDVEISDEDVRFVPNEYE